MSQEGRGGAREGSGRKPMAGVRLTFKLLPKEIKYLDRMVRSGHYMNRSEAARGCIDTVMQRKTIPVVKK